MSLRAAGKTAPWDRAQFAEERLDGLAGRPSPSMAALERVSRWKAQGPPLEPRLRCLGIGEQDLARLVDLADERAWDAAPQPLFPAAERPPGPEWLRTLWDIFREWPRATKRVDPGSGFEAALAPFVQFGLSMMRPLAGRCAHPWVDWERVEPSLAAWLTRRLAGLSERVLALELNVARLQNRLGGDDPADRFVTFVDALRATPEGWSALFHEYPVLARLMVTSLNDTVAAAGEAFERLREDGPALPALAGLGADGSHVVDIRPGQSDPHEGGRSVWLLELQDGRGERRAIVYKPRSFDVDLAFDRLLGWCNARLPADLPRLHRPRLLPRARHGWMEFVPMAECRSKGEVERFYWRQGALLALLHALAAIDMHCENIVAHGEHPVAVDLETLLHPRPPATGVAAPVLQRLEDSVLAVGLLPSLQRWSEGAQPINLGALGDERDYEVAGPEWREAATDRMRRVMANHAGQQRVQHLPRLSSERVPVTRHVEDVVAGFEAAYRLLASQRDELLSPNGPLEGLDFMEVRHVLRPTDTYMKLLHDALHPDCLRDALEFERTLDALAGWSASVPADDALPEEWRALRRCDVPLVRRRGMEQARAHLARLGAEDLEWQSFCVRAALASLEPSTPLTTVHRREPAPRTELRPDALLSRAVEVGECFARSALRGPRDVQWVGLTTMGSDAARRLAPIGPGLYAGTAGVGLFLAALAEATGEQRFEELARGALQHSFAALEEGAAPTLGAFEGTTSLLYVLAVLPEALREPRWTVAAHELLSGLAEAAERDRHHDVVAGSAGAIAALLAAHERLALPGALDVARICGRRLACAAQRSDLGWGWPSPEGGMPLTGFAHGASGVAWALERLAAALERHAGSDAEVGALRHAARQGLAYERSLFVRAEGNWPDLRRDARGSCPVAWCHGAPGVVIARLAFEMDTETRRDIEAGVSTTLARGLEGEGLCHGALGNSLIVRRVAQALGRDDWRLRAEQRLPELLGAWGRGREWPLAPGLMHGLAGVGWTLLHLCRPEVAPFVLGLETTAPAHTPFLAITKEETCPISK